jgi:hypothetical protein
MSTPVSVPPVEGPAAPGSFLSRFAGVFFSPRDTFADIARNPGFIAPLIALIVSSVAVTEAMLAKIGMERIVRTSIEQSKRASSMTSEQMQQAVEQGVRIGSVIAHLSGLLGGPIFMAIVAGIGLLIVNGIFGAQANFKTAFSISCYGYLVAVLGALMALAMIFFGDPEHFNAQNPMPSNVGFFLNPLETSKPWMALASSFDIFSLWFMALLGIGFSEATGRKAKALSVFLVYFGLWMIIVLGKVGLSMLG